ncbi:hypothetical protein Tco_0523056 [Tanacetum coccineum]
MADLPPPNHDADLPDEEPVHPEPAPIILHHVPAQPEGYVGDDDMEDNKEGDMEKEPIEQVVHVPNNMNRFELHMNPQPEGNMNRWLIEDDDDELGDDVVGDDEDDKEEKEEEEVWDKDEDWLMAPVTPPMATVLSGSTYEIGGPSTATPELPFPVRGPFSVIVDSVVVHHEEIGGLSVRTKNLEYAIGKLSIKIGEVSDARVEDRISIGEIKPKINTLEGRVEVLANQHDLMINKVVDVKSHVLKMKDRVDAYPCDQVVGLRGDVHKVIELSQQVQNLESSLQGTISENQQLQTRLAESESRESTMISYILWMENASPF